MTAERFSCLPGRLPGFLATLLLTLGCGDDATAPTGRELVGSWGSSEVELVALYAGAELRVPCIRFIIDDPILLDQANHFWARAKVDGPGLTLGDLPIVRLTGSVDGNRVTVAVPQNEVTPAATYLLDWGVTPAPPEVPACPA